MNYFRQNNSTSMSYSMSCNSSSVEIQSEPWGVEEESKREFPISNEREVNYYPPPRPEIIQPSSVTNTEAASHDRQRPQQVQLSGQTRSDSWNEVSPGVLSDGRWTRNHPLVHHYISQVKKSYGASVQADDLNASNLNTFPIPSDPRVYALAAICKEPYPDDPAWWMFFNARCWKESEIIINAELHGTSCFCTCGSIDNNMNSSSEAQHLWWHLFRRWLGVQSTRQPQQLG
ncbi:hypothetical protein NEOLEDRAFT_947298 [Neolentinus lepideus HHB14362 ss-1]|uniref:Uncharacterized protein n=1 Tax=Neolentinus lepideus HHB14362 ss-1 TaxID=1314782 RepID=A0A165UCF1_9AGAM|nr:hypothetical protein NEOLEDRAFT_947298 [Neolentinus lepideus HHB14362 ss-1]